MFLVSFRMRIKGRKSNRTRAEEERKRRAANKADESLKEESSSKTSVVRKMPFLKKVKLIFFCA